MNSLNRVIKEGEKVVLKKELFKEEYQSLEWRTVEIIGDSFGCYPDTAGSAIYVMFKDGERCRFEGNNIDAEATNKLNEGKS